VAAREDKEALMTWIDRSALPYSTETIWNAGLAGTAIAGKGRSLEVGNDADWMPEHLLLLAAESCYMSTLLTLARESGLEVLGYVSKSRLDMSARSGEPPALELMPCVVVRSEDDAQRVVRLAAHVTDRSGVASLLADRLRVTLDVRAVPDVSPQ
jgi:organic hydroperoxide reductase OsmC/OhrA